MSADDLHVAEFVTWWNDQSDWIKHPLPKKPLVTFDGNRCYDSMAGGFSHAGTELLYFNLPAPIGQPQSSAGYPSVMKYLLKAREKPNVWVDLTAPYWWDLPMLVALGQVDSIEVLNSHFCRHGAGDERRRGQAAQPQALPNPFGNARWSQDIYFQLLECGVRIPPSAGSGSGVSPNPVGYNRVYVHLDGQFSYDAWWKNFRAGQVFVTNGPLLRPTVEGEPPGHVFRAEAGKELDLEIGLNLSTGDAVSYLDIIQDGQVQHSVRLDEFAKTGRLPKLHFKQSGWFLVRAVTRSLRHVSLCHDGALLCGDRRPPAHQQAGGQVLSRLGRRAHAGRSSCPIPTSAMRCWSIIARAASIGRIWSRRRTRSERRANSFSLQSRRDD